MLILSDPTPSVERRTAQNANPRTDPDRAAKRDNEIGSTGGRLKVAFGDAEPPLPPDFGAQLRSAQEAVREAIVAAHSWYGDTRDLQHKETQLGLAISAFDAGNPERAQQHFNKALRPRFEPVTDWQNPDEA